MGDNKKYYWLKLKRDFFKRHDIRIIEEMPNGKDYILFYLKMLLESIDHEGELRFSDTIPYNEQMLSVITNTNIDIVRSAMKVFSELNMIEVFDDSTIYMAEVQKLTGSETAGAGRVRKHRENKKLLQCNANVKPCNTEIEKEKEQEKEEDKKTDVKKTERKKKAPASSSSFDSLIDTYSKGNTEVKELLGEWLKVRKAKRAAMTDRAIELNLQKLDRLAAESNMSVTEYLKEVICRGWNAFYPITDYSKGKTQNKPRYGNFDVNDSFNRAVRRTEAEMHQSDKDAKTVADDEGLKQRADALREKLQG